MHLAVVHTTTYRYAKPVTFGEHRVMYRPRVAHDIHLVDDSLEVSLPNSVRWVHDTFGNSVAIVSLPEPGKELVFSCQFTIEHFGVQNTSLPVEPRAEQIPVQHTPDEWLDLQGYLRPHTEDPAGSVAAWADSFVEHGRDTRDLLDRMMNTIRDEFTYQSRDSEGTQSPVETLRLGSGTCRDYAWLMIEALRRVGLACRFVSGYLYDPALDREDAAAAGTAVVGAGATHAWLHVYLPGAGWVPYDPTNRLTGGRSLIRVAFARHPGQAVPLAGSWFGDSDDYQGMSVDVTVRQLRD